jgi:hypothetical protein
MVIWLFRRRPPLWAQIARTVLIMSSAAGVAIGAGMLRRKLGLGRPRGGAGAENGRTAPRARVRAPRGGRGGRPGRRAVMTGSMKRTEAP